MRQYCRYCNNLVAGNGTYCTVLNKEMSDSKAKHTNNCKHFEFNPMDAFAETSGYKPRTQRAIKRSDGEQMQIALMDEVTE